MPKLHGRLPTYRRHRRSGQAVVTLNGKDHYLGPHGSETSRLEYDRLVAEWLAQGRQLPALIAESPEKKSAVVAEALFEFVADRPPGSIDECFLRKVQQVKTQILALAKKLESFGGGFERAISRVERVLSKRRETPAPPPKEHPLQPAPLRLSTGTAG